MKELLILLFLVLIFCIKLLRKNNENFKSNEAPVIPNPLIKETSKNIDSDYSDETGPKYYKNNPELKFRPTICDIKKSDCSSKTAKNDQVKKSCCSSKNEEKTAKYKM